MRESPGGVLQLPCAWSSPYLPVHVLAVLPHESHEILVAKQHVLLDDGDVGLWLAQLVQACQQELAQLEDRGAQRAKVVSCFGWERPCVQPMRIGRRRVPTRLVKPTHGSCNQGRALLRNRPNLCDRLDAQLLQHDLHVPAALAAARRVVCAQELDLAVQRQQVLEVLLVDLGRREGSAGFQAGYNQD
jgi:hypothetical protein